MQSFPEATGPSWLSTRHPLNLFLDLPTSTEVCDQPQSCSTPAASKRPDPRDEEIGAHEDGLTISRDRRTPAVDNARAEIPTRDRTTILLVLKDTMSSVISAECREEAGPEPANAERPRSAHRFFSASAPAVASTPTPSVLEVTPGKGAPCPGHPITVMSLSSNAITQSPRGWRMRHSDYRTRSTTSLSSIARWCPPSRPYSSLSAALCCSLATPHAPAVQYSRTLP